MCSGKVLACSQSLSRLVRSLNFFWANLFLVQKGGICMHPPNVFQKHLLFCQFGIVGCSFGVIFLVLKISSLPNIQYRSTYLLLEKLLIFLTKATRMTASQCDCKGHSLKYCYCCLIARYWKVILPEYELHGGAYTIQMLFSFPPPPFWKAQKCFAGVCAGTCAYTRQESPDTQFWASPNYYNLTCYLLWFELLFESIHLNFRLAFIIIGL